MYATMQCLQNALAPFATAFSYARKMFMKLTPGVSVIEPILFVTDTRDK